MTFPVCRNKGKNQNKETQKLVNGSPTLCVHVVVPSNAATTYHSVSIQPNVCILRTGVGHLSVVASPQSHGALALSSSSDTCHRIHMCCLPAGGGGEKQLHPRLGERHRPTSERQRFLALPNWQTRSRSNCSSGGGSRAREKHPIKCAITEGDETKERAPPARSNRC